MSLSATAQLMGVASLLPFMWDSGIQLSCQAWQHAPHPVEPSSWGGRDTGPAQRVPVALTPGGRPAGPLNGDLGMSLDIWSGREGMETVGRSAS